MINISPKEALVSYKSDAHNYIFSEIMNSRKEAIRLREAKIPKAILDKCIAFIEEDFSICFTPEETATIIDLYPVDKAQLLNYNDGWSMTRETISGIVSQYFYNSAMITYGDTNDDEGLEFEFHEMIRALAKEFGYKIK